MYDPPQRVIIFRYSPTWDFVKWSPQNFFYDSPGLPKAPQHTTPFYFVAKPCPTLFNPFFVFKIVSYKWARWGHFFCSFSKKAYLQVPQNRSFVL